MRMQKQKGSAYWLNGVALLAQSKKNMVKRERMYMLKIQPELGPFLFCCFLASALLSWGLWPLSLWLKTGETQPPMELAYTKKDVYYMLLSEGHQEITFELKFTPVNKTRTGVLRVDCESKYLCLKYFLHSRNSWCFLGAVDMQLILNQHNFPFKV